MFIYVMWGSLGLGLINGILLFTMLSPESPDPVTALFSSIGFMFFSTIGNIVGTGKFVLFFVWIYVVHQDLKKIMPSYPVSSGQSIARTLVPIYNIWGIWNVFSTLFRTYQLCPDERAEIAGSLRGYLIGYYLLLSVVPFVGFIAMIIIAMQMGAGADENPLLFMRIVIAGSLLWAMVILVVEFMMTQTILDMLTWRPEPEPKTDQHPARPE